MDSFNLAELAQQAQASDQAYLEFLRVPDLSVGLYQLKAGQPDPQQPHNEDEVYYVISGKGRIQVAEEHQPVGPGSIVYVPAKVPHHFYEITEDLNILVFFAPAESQ